MVQWPSYESYAEDEREELRNRSANTMFVNGTSRGWKVGMKQSDEGTKEKMSKSTKGLVLWNNMENLVQK